MTAVNISGTFTKDERPNNGLEAISETLVKDEFGRHVVVGIIELHAVTKKPGEAPVPTVKFVAVEPLADDAADQAKQILEQARRVRGLGPAPESLFEAEPAGLGGGDDDGGPVSERQRDEWLEG